MLLLMVFSFQISLVANSVEITLTSSMANITADTYKINKNIVTLTSNEEYIIDSLDNLTKIDNINININTFENRIQSIINNYSLFQVETEQNMLRMWYRSKERNFSNYNY